jgi:hypothetical protein
MTETREPYHPHIHQAGDPGPLEPIYADNYHQASGQEATQKQANQYVLQYLSDTLARMRQAKPEERSELARRYAISITELEKVLAYFKTYVVDTP